MACLAFFIGLVVPGAAATLICSRRGAFICAGCGAVDGSHCAACAARSAASR